MAPMASGCFVARSYQQGGRVICAECWADAFYRMMTGTSEKTQTDHYNEIVGERNKEASKGTNPPHGEGRTDEK